MLPQPGTFRDVEPDLPERPDKGAAHRLVSEIAEYLGLVFKPAAEELGLLMADEVQAWRLSNLRRLNQKLHGKGKNKGRANPRIAISALGQASATDDDTLLDMWAGLIDSSRAETPDDANITFVWRLAQMSGLQARILARLCELSPKRVSGDLLVSLQTEIPREEFFPEVSTVLLDQELDNLRSLGLIDGGFTAWDPSKVDAGPSALGLLMYVRCQGSQLAPADYFVLEARPLNEPASEDPSDGPQLPPNS